MSTQKLSDLLEKHLPVEVLDLESFKRWYEPLKWQIIGAVAQVHNEVAETLRDREEEYLQAEGAVRKRAWTVEGSEGHSLLKTPESIRDKVGRYFLEKGSELPAGRFSMDQLEKLILGFDDLARFRIVAELPSDVQQVRKTLIPRHRDGLLGRYPLTGKLKDFLTDLDLRRAGSGHRALQFAVFASKTPPKIRIEIQIMTRLQALWDRRNHPLYEWTRQGGSLPPRLRVNDLALAEALHLMDEQAERNWRDFLKVSRKAKR